MPETLTQNSVLPRLQKLVEQHFLLEFELAKELEELNQETAQLLSQAGLRGPSPEDLAHLEPLTARVQESSNSLARARRILLNRINSAFEDQSFESIREFISTLPPTERSRFDSMRVRVLERSSKAQANLVHNQAALFYTFDFHKKLLSGILQSDVEQQSYRADGQTQELHPGNIFRKTC